MKRKGPSGLTAILMGLIGMLPFQTVVAASQEFAHTPGENFRIRGRAVSTMRKEIDGYTVRFRIEPATPGMRHGGTHNLMVEVEKNGRALHDLLVNSRVTHPIKKTENKMMVRMGDWYMAGFDLGHPGTHRITVLFKTPDEKIHLGDIEYRTKGEEE